MTGLGEAVHLNLHTDFGLRVLLFLASSPTGTAAAPDIAQAFGISLNHLRKVVQGLAHAGYVVTARGRTGGISLAMRPEEIVVGRVVRDLEPDLRLVECFDPATNTCLIAPCCGLTRALEEARSAFFETLDRHTLADITKNRGALWALLQRGAAKPSVERA